MLPIHSVHCSLLPEQEKSVVVYFTSEHSIIVCTAQRLQARTSVTSYASDIYNFKSHSLRIMAEYPVMSTSQGTYVRIEQTSEAIRVTYEMCRAGGARTEIENRWFIHSVSSPGCAYQVDHKNQMSAFEVVGVFFYYMRTRLPPPLYAPATKHVCDKIRQKSFSTL